MKGPFKSWVALAALATGTVVFAAQPATASTGFATIAGGGTISPGLTVGGGSQTFSFNGSGTAVTDTYTGSFSCTVNGNDILGTLAEGSGSFTGNCIAGATTEPVSGTYLRVGGALHLNGNIGPGPINGSFTGACTFEATATPTVTSYDVQCHLADLTSAGAATVAGGGTISPGLTVGGGWQSFSFSGSGTAVTGTYTGSFSCTVNENDTVGTLAEGSGGFTGNCVAGATTEPVIGGYLRVGGAVELNASIGPGPINGSFTGVCTFESTSAPTVTSYDAQCHLAIH